MKKIFLTSTCIFAFCFSLNLTADEEHHQHGHEHGTVSAKAEMPTTLKGSSLYNSETRWKDQTGKDVSLKDYHGSKVLLTMAYTFCTYTCPLTVAKLKKIEGELIAKGITNYKIVLASFDSKRDTPVRLTTFMKQKELNPERWTWLAPKSDKDVRKLAALIGVAYSKDKAGEYSHSNVITLLSEGGEVIERLEGISSDHKSLIAKFSGQMNAK